MESEVVVEMTSADIIVILIPVLLVLLFLTILLLLWYSGFFSAIDVKTCKFPYNGFEVAYKYVKGSHKDSSLIYAEAHSLIPHLECIGIYYDDAKEVGENNTRSIIGLILGNESEKQVMQAKGFQITKFPDVEHVVYASFPHTSFLSVLIAIHKVVPKFKEYIKDKQLQAYPLIEVCNGSEIVYMAPLSNQSEFFVYEALAESEEEVTSDKTVDETEEPCSKDLEDLPDTISSVDSLLDSGSRVEDLPGNEAAVVEEKAASSGNGNGSEASTESFEELQLD